MLIVLSIGAIVGVMLGAVAQGGAGSAQQARAQEQEQLQHDERQQQQQHQQQQHPQLAVPLEDNPAQRGKSIFGLSSAKAAAAVGGLACLAAAAAISIVIRQRRRHGRSKQRKDRHADGRIPLKDLIRFKERQWFVEELENARDADPNAMVRLAKMYLNGQGCQQNIALAQEWVRKARSMGVPASLDELYATDDPDPHTKLRTLAAMEERRRALRQLNTAARAGHKHLPQAQQHTAAA